MANEIDLYKPTELYALIKTVTPQTGFLRQFFKDSTQYWHSTEDFMVDFSAEYPGISIYTGEHGDFKHVPDRGYSTNRYTPGYIKEKKVLTPQMLQHREAGNSNIMGKQSYGSKRDMKIGEHSAELRNRKDRLEEQQCSQALLTGTITIDGKGVDRTVDFGLPATHKITPSTLWSDATNAVPLDDLEDGITVLESDGADTRVVNIMGINAWRNFERTDQVRADLDNRRIEKGEIAPKDRTKKGAQYRGKFAGIGEIWTYSRTYKDKDDVSQNYMDADKVIQMVLDADFQAHYGPIADFDAPNQSTWEADMFLESKKIDSKTIETRLQSKPLMAPLDTNQWNVISPI